jgi:hypothetical protein
MSLGSVVFRPRFVLLKYLWDMYCKLLDVTVAAQDVLAGFRVQIVPCRLMHATIRIADLWLFSSATRYTMGTWQLVAFCVHQRRLYITSIPKAAVKVTGSVFVSDH